MLKNNLYPFTAVVGQEEAKKALLIALVNRRAGGLLIGGAKGTAKSVLARSVQSLIGALRLLNGEALLFHQLVDVHPVPHRGRHTPGRGVRLLKVAHAHQLRQLVAYRRRRAAKPGMLGNDLAADRLRGADIFVHNCRKYFLFSLTDRHFIPAEPF